MITNGRIGYNGRFGNQLFQFASTIGIARKMGYDVFFPKSNISNGIPDKNADNKPFIAKLDIVDCFDIDDKYFSNNIVVNSQVSERFFHFDEQLFNINDNVNIDGYLQSEKYFEHCKDEIIDVLKIKPYFIEIANELLPKTDKELVAIHIRRGDYVHISDYHSLNGVEFVNSAVERLGNKDKYHFVVCSDDAKWCEEIWGSDENFTVIKSNSSYIDFAIMTLCDHFIISNSSFSWWGSYLSKNPDKIVIAPKNWFGPKATNNDTTDLYRSDMIII
jgi:hypothetical protein